MAKSRRLKTRRSRVLVITALVVVVALAAFFAYRGLTDNESATVTYTTAAVQKMTLTSSVSGVGNVELSTSAVASPTVSGEVSGLAVAVGDTVRRLPRVRRRQDPRGRQRGVRQHHQLR